MVIFQHTQDVREWLEPFGYVEFWDAVASYNLTLQDRDHCDGQIASGEVAQSLMLSGLKFLAERELVKKFGLTHRIRLPLAAETMKSVH